VSELDQTLAALADPARHGAVDLPRRRPGRAGELALALSMTPAAGRTTAGCSGGGGGI
jgi:hypothetical protein